MGCNGGWVVVMDGWVGGGGWVVVGGLWWLVVVGG